MGGCDASGLLGFIALRAREQGIYLAPHGPEELLAELDDLLRAVDDGNFTRGGALSRKRPLSSCLASPGGASGSAPAQAQTPAQAPAVTSSSSGGAQKLDSVPPVRKVPRNTRPAPICEAEQAAENEAAALAAAEALTAAAAEEAAAATEAKRKLGILLDAVAMDVVSGAMSIEAFEKVAAKLPRPQVLELLRLVLERASPRPELMGINGSRTRAAVHALRDCLPRLDAAISNARATVDVVDTIFDVTRKREPNYGCLRKCAYDNADRIIYSLMKPHVHMPVDVCEKARFPMYPRFYSALIIGNMHVFSEEKCLLMLDVYKDAMEQTAPWSRPYGTSGDARNAQRMHTEIFVKAGKSQVSKMAMKAVFQALLKLISVYKNRSCTSKYAHMFEYAARYVAKNPGCEASKLDWRGLAASAKLPWFRLQSMVAIAARTRVETHTAAELLSSAFPVAIPATATIPATIPATSTITLP